jgi:hypothetical protein
MAIARKHRTTSLALNGYKFWLFEAMGHPESLGDLQVTSFRWLKFLDFTIIYWRKGVI